MLIMKTAQNNQNKQQNHETNSDHIQCDGPRLKIISIDDDQVALEIILTNNDFMALN